MRARLVSGLIFTCFAVLGAFGGCAVDTGPPAGDELGVAHSEASLSISVSGWYMLRRCVAPYCLGYDVKEVNEPAAITHVSEVVFSGLDARAIEDIRTAPEADVIVHGQLELPGPRADVPRLIVDAAYRGLPGVEPLEGDVYFRAPDRDPPIVCIAAPCNNIMATPLNAVTERAFTRLDLHRAQRPLVDGAWLDAMIRRHGALVTGSFHEGEHFPAGRELVLEVSQVYLKLPVDRPVCATLPRVVCPEGLRATFTRDAGRCLEFDTCASTDECLFFLPPECDAGYVRQGWATEASPCFHYACDPAFAL